MFSNLKGLMPPSKHFVSTINGQCSETGPGSPLRWTLGGFLTFFGSKNYVNFAAWGLDSKIRPCMGCVQLCRSIKEKSKTQLWKRLEWPFFPVQWDKISLNLPPTHHGPSIKLPSSLSSIQNLDLLEKSDGSYTQNNHHSLSSFYPSISPTWNKMPSSIFWTSNKSVFTPIIIPPIEPSAGLETQSMFLFPHNEERQVLLSSNFFVS